MMTSCSDFLDQRSPSELTEETVFNSIYYANNVLNKVYGSLTNDQTYSQYFAFVWCLNSDYELVDGFGADASNTSSERGNMNYNQIRDGPTYPRLGMPCSVQSNTLIS